MTLMVPAVVAIAYIGLATFAVAVATRIVLFARMPMHLRWELYPVPHEGKRARHGGSYLEEVDWWTKPRPKSHLAEVRAMALEILFLQALFEHNRPLWRRSYPFHLGIYLVIAATVLMAVGGIVDAALPGARTGGFGQLWQAAVVATGAGGLALGVAGALGLLQRRLASPDLRDLTSGADIFNLVFFIAAFGWALATFAFADPGFTAVSAVVSGLVRGALVPAGEGAAAFMLPVAVVLLAALVAYIPLTHMAHFVGKYFAYHAIRWNDTPNLEGGPQEKEITRLLGRKVSWAGPHVRSAGAKTWAEVATEEQRS